MVLSEDKIDINKIVIFFDETHHLYNDKPLYNKKFKNVMNFHSPGVAAVLDAKGAYHINIQGDPIYDKRFIKTFGFYDEKAAVLDESGWYHINLSGHPAYKARYDWVGNFQEERCVIRDLNGNYFHIKNDGTPAYDGRYKYTGDFKYGIAVVYDQTGFAQHIDRFGNIIHPYKFNELGIYHKGYATARDSLGAFHVDKLGKQLYPERYLWVEPFYNDFSFVCDFNGKKFLINEKGQKCCDIIGTETNLIQESLRTELMSMLVSYWKTQILYSIVKLEIFDHIQKGYNTLAKLQKKSLLPRESLEMIVRVLKMWNFIIEYNNTYQLCYLGELLTENHPKSLKYAALMWGDEHYIAMSKLFEALKTYRPQFENIYGLEIFKYFDNNYEKGAIINKAMKEYSMDYDELLDLYDFSDLKIIMDIGAGSGILLEKILKKNKNITIAKLFDLPSIVENAEKSIKNFGIKPKIKFIGGNFFDEIPETADTIIMSRILHDWNDDKVLIILKNVYKALENNGKLLIFETIVPEDNYMDIGVTLNFNLLVCVGGKERTLKEFQELLEKANLKINNVKTNKGIISLIVAEKIKYNSKDYNKKIEHNIHSKRI